MRLARATTYHVYTVFQGRFLSSYEVNFRTDVPEVLEIISSPAKSMVKRGKERDTLTLYVSELGDSTPNKRVNAPVRPVTALANRASAAPFRPARYAQR